MSWTDPVAAFREIAGSRRRMFWLDGGGARDWSGRRSLLGWLEDDEVSLTYEAGRRQVHRHTGDTAEVVGEDIFTVLAEELSRDGGDPSVSWVGYFGYASRPDLPARPAGSVPDAMWMRCSRQLVFEHPAAPDPGARPPVREQNRMGGPEDLDLVTNYRAAFEEVQRQLRLGNSYEVNLTYREVVDRDIDPGTAYLRLRRANPAPYAGYLRHGDTHLLSSSPERFATVDRNRWLHAKPIKGTTPRGDTAEADERQHLLLQQDPRFRAENLMIVDLLRNDLSMVCDPGTVTVPVLMDVESYPAVHQLVSSVRGHLRDGVGTVDALRALFPAGSMTGAPKLRTMQIIDAVEATPRGIYAGALGWISADGRADLGVVIRSLVGRPGPAPGSWRYELGTGGGITVRSDVEGEYDETRWKVARLLAALQD